MSSKKRLMVAGTLIRRGDASWKRAGEGRSGRHLARRDRRPQTPACAMPGPEHTSGSGEFRRGEAGDPTGATTTYAELLEDYLRVLGPDHPHTLITRNNLAHWRERAGESDPASW